MSCKTCNGPLEGIIVERVSISRCTVCGRGEMIHQPRREDIVRYSLPLAEVAPERGEQLHEAFSSYMEKVTSLLAMGGGSHGRA